MQMDECAHCDEPLPEGAVSLYFCDPDCQDLYYMSRSEPLAGMGKWYRWLSDSVERRTSLRQSKVWTCVDMTARVSSQVGPDGDDRSAGPRTP